jgi:integrase
VAINSGGRAARDGRRWGNDVGLVFTQPDGTPLYPQTITASFKRLSIEIGLPTIGVHGLRHSSATMMISSGLSPKVVSQRLGHSTVAITLDTYSHVLPAHDQAAADFIGRSLDSAARSSVCRPAQQFAPS